MNPGSNLLKRALKIIGAQTVEYYKFLSRSVNEIGMEVSIYDAAISIKGSFQSVPRSLYQQYGLDLNKNYHVFYSLNDAIDVTRDVSGDQIIAYGKTYKCEANNDWFSVDKWKGILLVEIPSS